MRVVRAPTSPGHRSLLAWCKCIDTHAHWGFHTSGHGKQSTTSYGCPPHKRVHTRTRRHTHGWQMIDSDRMPGLSQPPTPTYTQRERRGGDTQDICTWTHTPHREAIRWPPRVHATRAHVQYARRSGVGAFCSCLWQHTHTAGCSLSVSAFRPRPHASASVMRCSACVRVGRVEEEGGWRLPNPLRGVGCERSVGGWREVGEESERLFLSVSLSASPVDGGCGGWLEVEGQGQLTRDSGS